MKQGFRKARIYHSETKESFPPFAQRLEINFPSRVTRVNIYYHTVELDGIKEKVLWRGTSMGLTIDTAPHQYRPLYSSSCVFIGRFSDQMCILPFAIV